MADVIKRQIAYKAPVSDILSGSYVKQEGWEPNYILTKGNKKISRLNILGVVINIDPSDKKLFITIDDGSGNISIRSFEETNLFNNIEIGSIVLVIGKPREFGGEKYIIPEIIRKLENPRWIDVRKKELNLKNTAKFEEIKTPKERRTEEKEIKEEVIGSDKNDNEVGVESDQEKILDLIKELDEGDGVDIEEVITKSKIKECEEIINKLILIGEIFEIKPGIIKVLE